MKMPEIDLSPAALVLFGFLFYLNPERLALPFFLSCGAHELGHLGMTTVCGGRITSLTLRCFGAELRGCFRSYGAELAALLAGPAVNLLLLLIVPSTAWRAVNLYLLVFQLLPLPGLDGGRIWQLVLLRFAEPAAVDRIAAVTAQVFGAMGLLGGLWGSLLLRQGLLPLLVGLAVAARAFLPVFSGTGERRSRTIRRR